MANYSSTSARTVDPLQQAVQRRRSKALGDAFSSQRPRQTPSPTQDVHRLMGGSYGDPRTRAMKRLAQPLASSSEDLAGLGGALRFASHRPPVRQNLFRPGQQSMQSRDLMRRVGRDDPGQAAIKRLSGNLPPVSPADYGAGPEEVQRHRLAVEQGRIAPGHLISPPGLVPSARPAQPQSVQAPTERALQGLMGRYEDEARANLPTGLTPGGFSQRDVNSGSPILVRQDGVRFTNPKGYGGWQAGGAEQTEQRQVAPELANAVRERLGINTGIRERLGLSPSTPVDFQSNTMRDAVAEGQTRNARTHALRKAALEQGIPVENIRDMTLEDQNALLAERRSGLFTDRQKDLQGREDARIARGMAKGQARQQRLAQRAAGPDPRQIALQRLMNVNPELGAQMMNSAENRRLQAMLGLQGIGVDERQLAHQQEMDKARNELARDELEQRGQMEYSPLQAALSNIMGGLVNQGVMPTPEQWSAFASAFPAQEMATGENQTAPPNPLVSFAESMTQTGPEQHRQQLDSRAGEGIYDQLGALAEQYSAKPGVFADAGMLFGGPGKMPHRRADSLAGHVARLYQQGKLSDADAQAIASALRSKMDPQFLGMVLDDGLWFQQSGRPSDQFLKHVLQGKPISQFADEEELAKLLTKIANTDYSNWLDAAN